MTIKVTALFLGIVTAAGAYWGTMQGYETPRSSLDAPLRRPMITGGAHARSTLSPRTATS